MKTHKITLLATLFFFALVLNAHATFIGFTETSGANDYIYTTDPPNPVTPNPNDGILVIWDEIQNFTLTEPLAVDRVADPSAPFITESGGNYYIAAGTIVSSHYIQWDPGLGSSSTVIATLNFDSDIFAFIYSDQNLFDSDDPLGLSWLDYNDFPLRGIESGDTTDFDGVNYMSVNINWTASDPGDWTRLITAYSPGGEVPAPPALLLLGSGLAGLAGLRKKFNKR